MKISKKLISAIAMLTLSFVMLVTSSYAWFSMNEKVTAKGMNVTAKGNQVYLQIATASDGFTDGSAQTEAGALKKDYELLPSTVVKGIKEGNNKQTDPYVTGGAFTFVTNISNGEAGGLGAYLPAGEYSEATNGTNKYYLDNSFFFRLDPSAGAEASTSGLKVNSISLAVENADNEDFAKCLSVFIVNPTSKAGAIYTQGASGFVANAAVLSDAITSTPVQLDVYIFFDGEHPNCNLEDLYAAGDATYKVEIEFTCA